MYHKNECNIYGIHIKKIEIVPCLSFSSFHPCNVYHNTISLIIHNANKSSTST